MANIIRTFLCDHDEVLTAEPTFPGFRVLAQSRGVALAAAVNEPTKIIYLANPNNPTGTFFTRAEFDEFYRHIPPGVLLILDKAFYEYAHITPTSPIRSTIGTTTSSRCAPFRKPMVWPESVSDMASRTRT